MKLVFGFIAIALFFAACKEETQGPECQTPVSGCSIEEVVYTDVPNQSLDEWDFISNGYYQPQPRGFWITPNEADEFYIGGPAVERVDGEDALNGQGYAAKLTTRATLVPFSTSMPIVSGVLFSGTFTTDLSNPSNSARFGRPFNRRLKTVNGYYKYIPVDNDACGIYAFVRKCRTMVDTCGNNYAQPDTLGWGHFTTSEIVEEYTRFEFELDYTSNEIPDEVVIYFTSSDEASAGIGNAGSVLYIDELEVDYY